MAKRHQTKTGQANAVPADRAIVACRKACHETMEQYRGIASSSRTWKNCSATFSGAVVAGQHRPRRFAEVLLPIAAVAVGMTVLELAFHIASGGAILPCRQAH